MRWLAIFVVGLSLSACSTVTWIQTSSSPRKASDAADIGLFYAESDVPYPYVELASTDVVPTGHHTDIRYINLQIRQLVHDAAKYGAQGLILTSPDVPRLPAACVGENAMADPTCNSLTRIHAVAIAAK